ncbi:M48 family metallopeptidase [Patescibacteria group bacterium]|nr:M48 family metallopeptidase [Patescibacteria group bacterium]
MHSRKARSVRIRIRYSGDVLVSVPFGIKEKRIKRIILEKSKWIAERLEKINKISNSDLCCFEKEHYQNHKQTALDFVRGKVSEWNSLLKLPVNTIRVKNHKTKWGSCSNKNNLNFNYKILFLPREMQDYIIVHELCHLKEMNHSKRFWELVERYLPDYREIRGRF